MRDEAQFRPGKKTSNDSLEFVGSKKKSLFAQYTAQFQQKTDTGQSTARIKPVQDEQPQFTVRQSVQYQDAPYVVEEPTDLPLPIDVESFLNKDDAALKGLKESKIKRPHSEVEDEQLPEKKMTRLAAIMATVATLLGVGIIAMSILYIQNSGSSIPGSLRASVSFPVYELLNNTAFTVDKSSISKGANDSLVYVAEQKDNKAQFIISQQAVPEALKVDSQYTDFLSQTDKFASMDTKIGKAYFTKPANIGEDISVVVKTKDTLIFIRGNGATAEEKWAYLLSLFSSDTP
jgi:hypothetical protein